MIDLTGLTLPEGVTLDILMDALAIVRQIERDMISTRTKNALAVRKAKGLPMGRPAGVSRLDDKAEEINKYLGMLLNNTAIAKLVGCNPQTLANWLKVKIANRADIDPKLKWLGLTKKQIHAKREEDLVNFCL